MPGNDDISNVGETVSDGEHLISKKSNNEKDVHISQDLKFYKNKPRDVEKIIMIAGELVILKYLNRSKVQI